VLALAVYGQSVIKNEFVRWDDYALIVDNLAVQEMSLKNLRIIFTTYDPELYVPLTLLSYQFDAVVGGLKPALVHAHNLVLHILTTLLVGWFVFLLSRKTATAAVVAVLFAIHPLHTEAVAWASARKDLLSSFFYLLSLSTFLVHRSRASTCRWYIVSIVAFLLGLLAKGMILVLPLVLLLLTLREGRREWKSFGRELLPFFLLSVLFGIIALGGKSRIIMGSSFLEAVLLSGKATLGYLTHLFVPLRFSLLYPYTGSIAQATPDLTLSLLAVLGLTVAAWFLSKRTSRDLWCGWLLFLLPLVPSFFQHRRGENLGDIYFASDRYAYLPSIGIFLIVALGIVSLSEWGRAWMAGAGVSAASGVLFLSVLSFRQSAVWQNTESLFSHVLRFYPNSQIAHLNIGNHYQRIGDVNSALREYNAALKIRPTSLIYYNLGKLLLGAKDYNGAIGASIKALELDPTMEDAYLNLGVALLKQGREDEALQVFRKGYAVIPSSLEIIYNLASLSLQKGNRADAGRYTKEILTIDPEHPLTKALLQKVRGG